jgi:aminoglycoside phosphotransferase (APT) family kinase protein
VGAWLGRHQPPDAAPGLLHGDFRLANVLADPVQPAVAALIDWELATIGDSLLDLGWLLAGWPGSDGVVTGTIGFEPWDGMPLPRELVSHYSEHSTRDLSQIDWYTVLACYKFGIILEGTHVRSLTGDAEREVGYQLHTTSVHLFERAHEIMSGTSSARGS